LGVLDLGDLPDAAFIFKNVAGADIDAADLHGLEPLFEVKRASGRTAGRERLAK
jgi:hypothetical protein